LLDLAALVVGYSLAAMAARTLWPAGVTPRGPVIVVFLLGYTWLGLAMSGPFVLLRRSGARAASDLETARRPRRAKIGRPIAIEPDPPELYTRAEMAWLMIGGYWIAAAVLVIPTRLPTRSAPILGLLPILAAGLLWVLGSSRPRHDAGKPPWTHRVAVALLATWPLAWLALILLTATFG
jgi:hypothetical protein